MKEIVKALMLVIILLTLAACSSNVADTTPKKITVLVYMEGTNLEKDYAAATLNINEMLAATASSEINIILETGAADKAVSSDPVQSWRTVKRHLIRNNAITELQDLNNIDMGTSEAVSDFITWGQTEYPADRYVLVFWDHGGGTLGGFGGNSFPVASSLSVSDLSKAVTNAVNKTGKKFELIGFDACLMATLEVAYSFKDTGSYLVSSEEIEPGAGWDWKGVINYIAAKPTGSGLEIGTALADKYYAKMVQNGDNAAVTMSVADLTQIQPLVSALAAFATWQQGLISSNGDSAWFKLAYARSRSLDFYNSDLDPTDTTDMVDLVDLAIQLDSDYAGAQQIKDLESAMTKAVPYKVNGPLREQAKGLSLMFPTSTVWSDSNRYLYKLLAFVTEYQNFVESYSTYARTIIKDITISNPVNAASVIKADITPVYNYDQAYIAMTDGYGSYYGHQPIWPTITPKTLEYAWDGSWYTLNDNLVSLMASPASEPVVTLKIPMEAEFSYPGSTEVDTKKGYYYLRHDYVNNKTEYLGFLPDLKKQASRGFIQLKPGANITPLTLYVDAFTPFGTWIRSSNSFKIPDTGLVFSKFILKAGSDYNLAFTLYDLRMKPSFSKALTITK